MVSFSPQNHLFFFKKNQYPISGQVVMVFGVKGEDILLEVDFAALRSNTESGCTLHPYAASLRRTTSFLS